MATDQDVAEAFLDATNPVYDECAQGVTRLDRIVVGSPSLMASQTRAALVPALYAFWERFFRLSLSEAYRVTAVATLDIALLCEALGKVFFKECVSRSFTFGDKRVSYDFLCSTLGDKAPGAVARTLSHLADFEDRFYQSGEALCGPVSFAEPENLVETDSNVKFFVLQRNLERLGASHAFSDINKKLASLGFPVEKELNEMVSLRNDIAHGGTIAPVAAHVWNRHSEFAVLLMNQLQLSLYDHFLTGRHRAS